MEAARYISYIKPSAKIIINDYRMPPLEVTAGGETYPDNVIESLSRDFDVTVIDANSAAEKLGNSKAMNIVLLGALVKSMYLTDIDWNSIIADKVKPSIVKLNQEALAVGMASV